MDAVREYQKSEIINGVEYAMSPPSTKHRAIQGNLFALIFAFLQGKRCKVFFEHEVVLDEENVYQPDILVVCDPKKIKGNHIEGAPDFVAEILSPSTKKRDITVKKKAYEKYGVKEYWIISQDESIEVYRLGEDSKYELDNVYQNFTEYEWSRMTEKERSEQSPSLKLSLYDDLEIEVKDIFEDVNFFEE